MKFNWLFKFIDDWEAAFLGWLTGISLTLFTKSWITALISTIFCVLLIIGRFGKIWRRHEDRMAAIEFVRKMVEKETSPITSEEKAIAEDIRKNAKYFKVTNMKGGKRKK